MASIWNWNKDGRSSKSASSRSSTSRRIVSRWEPTLERLEDRVNPAPVIEVFLAVGPSPTGPSDGYVGDPPATSPGFGANTTTGLRTNPPTAVGNPAQTPSAFVPLSSGSRVTAEQMVASGFPSWMARANPGTTFGPTFANELGNFVFFVVRVRETDAAANSFRAADLAVNFTASNPTAAAFFGPAGRQAGWIGDLNTTDRIGFLANGTQVSGAGSGSTFIHEFYFTGRAVANDANGFSGTDQQRLDQAVAELRTLQDAPGRGFSITATYNLQGPSTPTSASGTVLVDTPRVDLVTTKTDAPDPVLAGQTLTYTIAVGNSGPDNATGVTLTDTLPAGTTFVSATPSQGTVSNSGNTVTANLGVINNGANATVTIVVQAPTTPGTITNTATATATEMDINNGNNTATATTTVNPLVNLAVTKTDSPDPVRVAQNLTYTITVANSGPNNATGVTLTDTLPAGVTFVSATSSQGTVSNSGNTVTATLGTINNGANSTITIVVRTPNTSGTITNTATATATETDVDNGNNTATQTTNVTPLVDLVVTKTDSPDPVPAGQNLTYTITVGNSGPDNATGVTLTDTLPAGVTFVSANASQGTVTNSGATVTASLGAINSSANATITIVVRAPVTAGTITNTATATATQPDTNNGNNTATQTTTVNAVASLVISKTASPDSVAVGQNLTYTILVTNSGPSSATAVTVTDPLPANVNLISGTSSQGTVSASGNTVTANLGTLPNGGSATITIVVTPTSSGTLTNSAMVTTTAINSNSGSSTASEATSVTPPTPPIPGQLTTPNRRFVAEAYRDLLLREASPAEIELWANLLDQGTLNRAGVVQGIEASLEYRTLVVQQLYQRYLGRAADAGGLVAFVNFLGTGATIEQAQAILLGSNEYFVTQGGGTTAGFIQAVYGDVLGRAASAAEIQSWQQFLAAGASRQQVAAAILNSPEADAVDTQAFFQHFLNRSATPEDLTIWVNAFQHGITDEQAIAGIVSSREYWIQVNGVIHQLYVAQLYRDILQREVDASGLAYWTGLLNDTLATPYQVALGIQASTEAQIVTVQNLYLTYLKRPADPGGLNSSVNFLAQGGTNEQLAVILTSSTEYFQTQGGGMDLGFLTALYRDALGRAIDPSGLSTWSTALASGASRAGVASGIFGSTESRTDLVQDFYQELLDRTAEAAGLNAWVAALAGGARDQQVIAGIASGPEYFSKL